MLKKLLLALLLLSLSPAACWSQDWRSRPPAGAANQLELNTWALRDYSQAHQELQSTFKALLLGSDAEAATALINSQRAWLAYRDAQAEAAALRYRGGSIEPMIRHISLAESSRLRNQQLATQLREQVRIQGPPSPPEWLIQPTTSEAALKYLGAKECQLRWADPRWRCAPASFESPEKSQSEEWSLSFEDSTWTLRRHGETVASTQEGLITSGFLSYHGVPETLWTPLLGLGNASAELEVMAFMKNWDAGDHYLTLRRAGPWIQVGCRGAEPYNVLLKQEENGLRKIEVLGGAWLPKSLTELGVPEREAYQLTLGLDYQP